jgi:hypothetical protein
MLVERLRLSDGRTVVLKAATRWRGVGDMVDAALRTEIELHARVPGLAPWRPTLLATVGAEDWLGLAIEDLDQPGRREPPWSPSDAESIAVGLAAMHEGTLGSTHPAGVIAWPTADYWRRAADEGSLSTEWRRWVRAAAPAASSAISVAAGLAKPRCVTHGDVYDNNIFLVGGQLRLIDWTHVGWTSPARDAVSWALSGETWSGISAPKSFQTYEQHAGVQPVEEKRSAIAGTTGYMILRLGQVGSGTQDHQYLARRLQPAARWLAQELDLEPRPETQDLAS